jgi:hypothetical protein
MRCSCGCEKRLAGLPADIIVLPPAFMTDSPICLLVWDTLSVLVKLLIAMLFCCGTTRGTVATMGMVVKLVGIVSLNTTVFSNNCVKLFAGEVFYFWT